MKKLLLEFDDAPASLDTQYIFHNEEDMKEWFYKNSDIFTKWEITGDIVQFTVNHSWKSFATFKYVTALL